MITQNATIFERVCPLDQTYDQQYYAGINFLFVIITDRDLLIFSKEFFIFDFGNLENGLMLSSMTICQR